MVAQSDMDKLKAWENYHFDALFHGNDWKNSAMYDEIEKKFRANAQSILDGETSDNIVHIVARFDQLDNLRGFMEMLA